jgi:modulator of FtsH protease HflK
MVHSHQFNPDERNEGVDEVPIEGSPEPMDVEAPRRAASAQFEVDSEIGAQAALREAMDPANQSLADALRLSYRVLQLVIVILLALFFITGVQTVDDGQRGVLTRWGRIVPVGDQTVLEPGLKFSIWPYPVSEFIIFDVDNRHVTPRDPITEREPFWPDLRHRTLEQATETATVGDPPRPGRDGYVLTRDGDIAHLRLSAMYHIDSPVDFVHRISEAEANRLVDLALQRATVHVVASVALQELIDLSEDIRTRIMAEMQRSLSDLECGIQVDDVTIAQAEPALAIRRAFGELQNVRIEMEQQIEGARRQANQTLVRAAGERHRRIYGLIRRYEDALHSGYSAQADEMLVQINQQFDSGELSGEVASIIERARAFRSHVQSELGAEARRFLSLLPTFREHPEMVVRQLWLEAYADVLGQKDAEVYFVPPALGSLHLALSGSYEVKELRQQMELDRKEHETYMRFGDRDPYLLRAYDMIYDRPGRQLQIEDGRARGLRRD